MSKDNGDMMIELTPETYLENAIKGVKNVADAVNKLQTIKEQLIAKKAERKASFINIFTTSSEIRKLRSQRGAQKRFMNLNRDGIFEITDKVCEMPTSKKTEEFDSRYFSQPKRKAHR
jgi:hypothetical protein